MVNSLIFTGYVSLQCVDLSKRVVFPYLTEYIKENDIQDFAI